MSILQRTLAAHGGLTTVQRFGCGHDQRTAASFCAGDARPWRAELPGPAGPTTARPALLSLTPPGRADEPLRGVATIRTMVDATTAFGAGRPLGISLRRSLLRYYFLRRAGLPLVIHFARQAGRGHRGPCLS